MRAAVLNGYNEPLVIEELREPALGPRDVRVQIDASGVCHSDLTVQRGGVPMPVPLILGHEGAGTVVETGPEVSRVTHGRPRDRIVHPRVRQLLPLPARAVEPLRGLDRDDDRGRGATRDDGSSVFGMTGLGTFADVMMTSEASLGEGRDRSAERPARAHRLRGDNRRRRRAATAKVQPGSTVAVIGCGGVGQSVIQGARIAGASRIFAVDPVELKRKTAEQLGATDLVDPAQGDPIQQVKAATGGRGTDYAFEVIGFPTRSCRHTTPPAAAARW